MLRLHGFCLGEMLITFWHVETIEPSVLCGETFGRAVCAGVVEEQYVCGNRSIRSEDAAWQTDDGVQVEISKQLRLDGNLCVVSTKEETVWHNDRRTPILL